MLKVLIIDDEVQIRKGLRMKVDWEQEGFEIVAEAANGKEALEIIETIDVDIAITDVRMPIMDGIQFVTRCSTEYPHIKLIVLSGYSDFDYAKSSMKAGVKDYLLKPVAPDELLESIKRIEAELKEVKEKELETERMHRLVHHQLEDMQEQYLLYLVKEDWSEFNIVTERLQQLQLKEFALDNVRVQFVTVEIRGDKNSGDTLRELWLPFKMLCKEIAQETKGTVMFYDTTYANTVHFIHRIETTPLTNTAKFIKGIQEKVKLYLKLDTVIGIGKVVTSLQQFKAGYISALLSWSQSQLGSHSQVITSTVANEVFDFSIEIEKKLMNAVENADQKMFINNIHSIFDEAKHQSIMSFSFVANRVLFLLGSLTKKYDIDKVNDLIWECQQSIWELNSQNKVIDQLLNLAKSIIESVSQIRTSSSGLKIVDNVRNYLVKHYASEISLTSLSKQFHINSAYLSEIFKQHVGENFSDYLIRLRMENAMEFLKDPQLKIIDVAHLVGFSNSGYFSTVFKKYFGQTPAEYRKTLNL